MIPHLLESLAHVKQDPQCDENVSIVDAFGTILYASHGHDEHGLPSECLKGTNVMIRVHPQDRKYVEEAFTRMLITQLRTHIEYRFRNDFDEWLTVASDGGPIGDGTYVIVSKITKQSDLADLMAYLVYQRI